MEERDCSPGSLAGLLVRTPDAAAGVVNGRMNLINA
jgi:hypothetical protein